MIDEEGTINETLKEFSVYEEISRAAERDDLGSFSDLVAQHDFDLNKKLVTLDPILFAAVKGAARGTAVLSEICCNPKVDLNILGREHVCPMTAHEFAASTGRWDAVHILNSASKARNLPIFDTVRLRMVRSQPSRQNKPNI